MAHFICVTCGTQYAASEAAPPECRICGDERQFVPPSGQSWTTLDAIRQSHTNNWRAFQENLLAFGTVPSFGIGQRAFLLRSAAGNVLWDCITLIDEATVTLIRALGGLAGIAISHPHYYTTMVEWARVFGCEVHLHSADREWVMRSDPAIRFWEGETKELLPGLTLIRAGGHYPGGTVLHWRDGAAGKGALLSGDILQVLPDGKRVSFMWSYPCLLPLPAHTIRDVAAAVAPYEFDRVYGAFWNREILGDGKRAIARSADRYIALLER